VVCESLCCCAGGRLRLQPDMVQYTNNHNNRLAISRYITVLLIITCIFNRVLSNGKCVARKKNLRKKCSMGFSHLYIQLSIHTLLARCGSLTAGVSLRPVCVSETPPENKERGRDLQPPSWISYGNYSASGKQVTPDCTSASSPFKLLNCTLSF